MNNKNIFTKESIREYVEDQKKEIMCSIRKKIANNALPPNMPSPKLLIIQVGDNAASNKYVSGKIADCKEVGIQATLLKLSENITHDEMLLLLKKIAKRNSHKKDVCPIIIQLPLPKHLEKHMSEFIKNISPKCDIDGFRSDSLHEPCTPLGICRYLEQQNGSEWFIGKHAVIVGRSSLVGKPLAKMLLDRDCTVTIAHSKTKNLKELTRQADILVSATGQMNLIDKDYIKPDVSAVINVGFAFDENGKMKGDINVEDVLTVTENCMPIIGSTGLLTRLAMLQNVYNACFQL